MNQSTLSAEDSVKEICEKNDIPTPIEFLTKIMGGTDPRQVSLVYHKIVALEEEYGEEPPDIFDWLDLVELIKREYRHSIVEIGKSQDAAKQLMEYMHPKRKSIEKIEKVEQIEEVKLTRREIRNIKKAFDLDY